ncbi:exonuclease domain-containing protein [Paenibacillus urinalis]|uniref:Exonuclease domain-containing protein n=1 Tax=Paenibacillus urinalis TaxID=521520 RepID=A0AAX3N454_9BACL|nr:MULTISPECIES: exonuclease domain-containing protein [Paenibacillus]WDH84347.1 exonuclease domain-containing protein [Paenibacillus urinalis]WDH95815.1 exonuclease domain-containing protein [Paenibacillus urinalis]WDI04031.1 exonuclease domain-containing protein [Paenibacillus urinalis]GAK38658.1 DNA polymerase III subunit epsilon [Paenibacillus sp. TCA20]
MKDPVRGNNGFWNSFRQGGVPSAIASMLGAPTAQQMAFLRSLMRENRKPEALRTPLSELDAVVFDLETTGFAPQHGDEILSFGAVRVVGGEIIEDEQFYTLVKPKVPIPEHITELTGITPDMTRDAPPILEGLHDFMSFVGGRVLVAHASAHDKSFLNAALWKTSRVRLSHRVIDTMMLARWLEPQRNGYGLDECLESRGIPIHGRHHALKDAMMTARLWGCYLDDIAEMEVHTLSDLYDHLSHA